MDTLNPFVLSLAISLAIQAVFFAFAWRFKTDKVTDLSYGLSFISIGLYWFLSGGWGVSDSSFRLLLTFMVVAWALRLSGYLLYRVIKNGKDSRFDEMRNSFAGFGKFWLLQGIGVWAIMLPVIYLLSRDTVPAMGTLPLVGLYVWSFGLTVESYADFQLNKFRSDKINKGKWIDSGLWRYSQHPNYFGEIVLWWGVFIYGISEYSGAAWLVIVGPLTITGLLLFGSGIPILEKANKKRWGKNSAYKKYLKTTSILVPMPKRRS